ncbi:hypothetical protein GGX14DRAFT_404845 [Mycena pura]|uniref:Uncharacterized protein n=1 Tax=Mycena pura TaxID=153505 RepID=A0AAD6UV12_9AGAR|nr:hypothetical protein GGX14DRAFT_404845 [Mycena pura]
MRAAERDRAYQARYRESWRQASRGPEVLRSKIITTRRHKFGPGAYSVYAPARRERKRRARVKGRTRVGCQSAGEDVDVDGSHGVESDAHTPTADVLGDKIDNHNFLKNLGQGEALQRKLSSPSQSTTFRLIEPDVNAKWKKMIDDWQVDRSKPNYRANLKVTYLMMCDRATLFRRAAFWAVAHGVMGNDAVRGRRRVFFKLLYRRGEDAGAGSDD